MVNGMPYHETVAVIETLLAKEGVPYQKFEHAPVRTSEEAAAIRPGYSLSQGAKALIVRVKKGGEKTFAMIVVPGDAKFDSGRVRAILEASDIRFATPEEVATITHGVEPGGVPPFGTIWNLPVIADESVFQNETIIFNAGDRRVSIAIPSGDYLRVVLPKVAPII